MSAPVKTALCASALLLGLTLEIGISEGQSARDPAAAEALFNSAKELLKNGDWPSACAKLQASMDLDPAVATLLKLAKCREHEGKLAAAWYDYQRALSLNTESSDEGPERRKELDDFTRKAIAAIEPRVPRLRIVMAERPLGLRITRDGRELPTSTLGEALPLDPGAHEIVAEASGYRTERRTVTLAEQQSLDVTFKLFAIASEPPAAEKPIAAPADGDTTGRSQRIAGIAVGSAGIVALGFAGAFGIKTLQKVDEADPECIPEGCTEKGATILTDAEETQTTAFVLLGVGAVATGVGIGLYLAAPKPDPERAAASSVRPDIALSLLPGGLSLWGRW